MATTGAAAAGRRRHAQPRRPSEPSAVSFFQFLCLPFSHSHHEHTTILRPTFIVRKDFRQQGVGCDRKQ